MPKKKQYPKKSNSIAKTSKSKNKNKCKKCFNLNTNNIQINKENNLPDIDIEDKPFYTLNNNVDIEMHNDQTSLKSKESSLHNNEENLDTIIKISLNYIDNKINKNLFVLDKEE